jgi:hypothetical protein
MLDEHAVAAFLSGDGSFAHGFHRDVFHVVSPPDDTSGRRGEHLYSLSLYFQIPNPDVGAVVPVIAASAAAIVAGLVGRIVIDIVLKEAAHARLASDRQRERDGFLGLGVDRAGKPQRNQDQVFETTRASVRGMCRMHGIGVHRHPLTLASCDDFREADIFGSGR